MPIQEWQTYPQVGSPEAAMSTGEVMPWQNYQAAAPDALAPQSQTAIDLQNVPKGVVQGIMDVPVGGAQLGTRALEEIAPNNQTISGWGSDVDQYIKSREASYAKNFPGGKEPSIDLPRTFGNMVADAPVAYAMPGATAENLGARVLSNAASGAVTGAMQPVDPGNPNYWDQKGTQAVAGGVSGAAMAPVAEGAARVISPNVNPDVKLLLNQGVTPTPGQIAGGWFKDLEDKFTGIPGLGDAIKDAKLRAVNDLNGAAINRSLSHIGELIDPGTAPGREAIDQMHTKIGNAYDQLLPNLTWQADPQFLAERDEHSR